MEERHMKPLQHLVVSLAVLALGAALLYAAWLAIDHAREWYAMLDAGAREAMIAAAVAVLVIAAAASLAARWRAAAHERVRDRRRLRTLYRDALAQATRAADTGALPVTFPNGAAWLTCGASPAVLAAVRRLRERVALREDVAAAVTSLALAMRRDLGLPTVGLSDAALRELLALEAHRDAAPADARAGA
jgi:hypothetical protein